MKDKQGFTLLEILVVVLIIGILAAVALPQYQLVIGRTKLATVKDNAHTLARAIQHYYLIHDKGPESLNDLDVTSSDCGFNYDDENIREIICNIKVGGKQISYIAQAHYNKSTIYSYCYSYDPENLSSITNRVCQKETNRTAPTRCSYYCVYPY